ncbi:MAG: hypothetical protein ACFCVK_03155 [Acidimicrobiales bacterium]
MSYPLYSLAIAYTNDWLTPDQVVGASAALVTVNGVGAMIGPVVAAILMFTLGVAQFFVALLVTHGAEVVYLGYRLVRHDGLPLSAQLRYRPFPARASAVATVLLPRGGRRR